MDLDAIRVIVANNNYHLLKREPSIDAQYTEYRNTMLETWVSIEDVIKVKYLGANKELNSQGYYTAQNFDEMRYALEFNEYPYAIGDNILHLVLWSSEPLTKDIIEEILRDELLQLDYFWFEQVVDQKSVKGVWHVHVFVAC
jgi:hypothetical protein